MPEDFFLTLNESVVEDCTDGKRHIFQIQPVSYAEYGGLMTKPYKYPIKSVVWRLITGKTTSVMT